MKSKLLLKLCAVAGSLLLVAGFVSYRAGALDWLRTPGPSVITTPVAPVYTPVQETSPEAAVTPHSAGEQMFYSSKSGAVFIEPETTSPPVQPTQDLPEETVIFSGSKSLMAAPAGADK